MVQIAPSGVGRGGKGHVHDPDPLTNFTNPRVVHMSAFVTYNQPATSRNPGAPVTMVSVLQSLMAYANPGKIMTKITYPTHTRVPAVLRCRMPENSVANTNIGIL